MLKRLYNFLSGTRISSSQVNGEFDQLIGEANNNAQADSARDTALRAIAQLAKITNDSGGVKLSVSTTTDDILDKIVNAGQGFHTFYAVSGSKNLPPTNISIRGIAHMTSAVNGWVLAFDYKGNVFFNYVDLNSAGWIGWNPLVTRSNLQENLWSSSSVGLYMSENQEVAPSKKLTECRNGWILVWSDYDPGSQTPNNYDFCYTYIPKFAATNYNQAIHLFSIPRTPAAIIVKKITVSNDKLVGWADNTNSDTGANDVVLRYVLEW